MTTSLRMHLTNMLAAGVEYELVVAKQARAAFGVPAKAREIIARDHEARANHLRQARFAIAAQPFTTETAK